MKTPLHRTLFASAGQAVLITRTPQGERATRRRFKSPEAALGWCRVNGVVFVWLPEAGAMAALN